MSNQFMDIKLTYSMACSKLSLKEKLLNRLYILIRYTEVSDELTKGTAM
jgi:hypothetical protein